MANKVTLDFEKNEVIWDTDSQKGIEFCPDLAARKPQILAAMGYETVDMSSAVNAVNAFINGDIDTIEFLRQCDAFVKGDTKEQSNV